MHRQHNEQAVDLESSLVRQQSAGEVWTKNGDSPRNIRRSAACSRRARQRGTHWLMFVLLPYEALFSYFANNIN